MNKPILDSNIYNTINPNCLQPKANKPLPFPLENFDEHIAAAYGKMDLILKKIEAAEHNPVNKTPARKRRLKSLKYKIKTSMKLIQEVSISTSELWY